VQVIHAGLIHADFVTTRAGCIGNHAGVLESHVLDHIGAARAARCMGIAHRMTPARKGLVMVLPAYRE
jgi:hypothetical protein